jgi:hypothetical protein
MFSNMACFHPLSVPLSYPIHADSLDHCYTVPSGGAMATSLRKVSQNLHLAMKRAQIATIVSPYLPDSEALNERNESAHAYPIGVGFSLLLANIRSCIVQVKVMGRSLSNLITGQNHLSPLCPGKISILQVSILLLHITIRSALASRVTWMN